MRRAVGVHRALPVALAAIVGTAVLVASGCDEGKPSAAVEGWAGTVDTTSGGAVRVRNPSRGMLDGGRGWRLEPDLHIGELDGEPAYLFGDVRDVREGPGGLVHVADATSDEIRVFGPDGSHLRTLGGRGEGPGEFRYPATLFWSPHGELWVYDIQNARFTVFTPDGELSATHPLASLSFSSQHGFDASGTLLQVVGVQEGERGDIRSYLVPTEVRGSELVPLDTFPAPRFETETFRATFVREGRSMAMVIPVPFSPTATWRLDPRDGSLWIGTQSADYRLVRRTLDGDTLRIVEREYEPVPVTDEELDSARSSLTDAGYEIDLQDRRVPRNRPPYQTFHVAPDGTLWVGGVTVFDGGRRRSGWDIFDSEGRYLGPVSVPPELEGLAVLSVTADHVYGTLRGELDEVYVVRARIATPAPPAPPA